MKRRQNVKRKFSFLPESKHNLGYTRREVKTICKLFSIPLKKFWKVFGVNTVAVVDKETIYYPVDVERTLAQILGYRRVSIAEWD